MVLMTDFFLIHNNDITTGINDKPPATMEMIV